MIHDLCRQVIRLLFLSSFLIVFLLILDDASAAKRGPNISLGSDLTTTLNQVLDQTVSLQKSVIQKRADESKIIIAKLVQNLDSARRLSASEPINIRSHLLKLLNASEAKLVVLLNLRGDVFRASFREAMETVAHFPRIYRLDQKYRILFCDKDKASWVQDKTKPQNPVSPDRWLNCGSTVE